MKKRSLCSSLGFKTIEVVNSQESILNVFGCDDLGVHQLFQFPDLVDEIARILDPGLHDGGSEAKDVRD